MKYYVECPCDNISIISKKIYNFLETKTDKMSNCKPDALTPRVIASFTFHNEPKDLLK
jgi:hypothetical protein